MRTAYFLIPGDIETRTGGYLYDRQIMAGLSALGWQIELHRLDGSFPTPTPIALRGAAETLAALPEDALVIIDGLALGALPEIVSPHRERLRLVGLVHHPLALETGLDTALQDRLRISERAALTHVRQIIVTSPHTVRALADYDVSARRCAVVLPGTDPAPLAQGSGGAEPVLLCAASLTPRKGHAVLLRALARMMSLSWHLRCAGSATLDSRTAITLRALAVELGLDDRIEWLGELNAAALAACYQRADLFVLPSWYEGYGMVLAEALAHGLPIVSTTGGAIPDTVPVGAGLLVPPGDDLALAEVLTRVLTEPELRKQLADGARLVRNTLPDWPSACAQFSTILERVIA